MITRCEVVLSIGVMTEEGEIEEGEAGVDRGNARGFKVSLRTRKGFEGSAIWSERSSGVDRRDVSVVRDHPVDGGGQSN